MPKSIAESLLCSRDLKSKRAIKLKATKDTTEIFSLSALFLCCLCEIQCAIMARTDPSFDAFAGVFFRFE